MKVEEEELVKALLWVALLLFYGAAVGAIFHPDPLEIKVAGVGAVTGLTAYLIAWVTGGY